MGDALGRDLFGTGTYWRPMLLPARNSNSYSFAYIPPGFRVVLAIIDPAISGTGTIAAAPQSSPRCQRWQSRLTVAPVLHARVVKKLYMSSPPKPKSAAARAHSSQTTNVLLRSLAAGVDTLASMTLTRPTQPPRRRRGQSRRSCPSAPRTSRQENCTFQAPKNKIRRCAGP